jgi:hypothetical protein
MGEFEDAIRATRARKGEERARADALGRERAAELDARRKAASEEYAGLIWRVLREAQRDLEQERVPVKTDMIAASHKPSWIAIGADHSPSKSVISILRRDEGPYIITWDVGGANVQEWREDSARVASRLREVITAAIERSVS